MTDLEKYVEALNNILGADNAYFQGDKDVDTIVELIKTVKSLEDERETMLKDLQFRTNQVVEQKAEIERLSNSAKQWEETAKQLLLSKEKTKAEAIKEFMEKLKDLSCGSDLYDRDERWVQAVTVEEIDETYKEMGLE